MRTDGQTDMMKLIVAFHNLANALTTNCKRCKQRDFGPIAAIIAEGVWKD